MADSDNSMTFPFVTFPRKREDAELAGEFTSGRKPRAGMGIVLSQKDRRSRNDEALVYARDFMASVGAETPRDAAKSAASNTPDPSVLARSLHTRFDQAAITVAAWCALLAHCEASDASYQTWKQVFARLRESKVPE